MFRSKATVMTNLHLVGLAVALAGCFSASSSPTPAPTPVPVAADPTIVAQPTVAADPTSTLPAEPTGLRVVFPSDEGVPGNDSVWLWEEGGVARQLSTMGGVIRSVSLSDDGQVVAYVREVEWNAEYELWAVNSDGSDERLLVGAAELNALPTAPDVAAVEPHQLAWVPGTHTLAYNTHGLFNAPGVHVNGDLHLVDVDTLARTVLFTREQADEGVYPPDGSEIVYAPDGSQIALVTPSSISLINADGSNRRGDVLTYTKVGLGESAYYPEPVWSPDSRRLAVAIPSTGPYDGPPGPTALWELPADGSLPTQLGSVITPGALQSPVFSPDLSKIAYLSASMNELHISNADGSGDVAYDTAESFAGWAPDGERFVYVSGGAKLGQLGGDPEALADVEIQDPFSTPVMWVDAERFLYLSPADTGWAVQIVSPGSPATRTGVIEFTVFIPTFDFSN
jgi:Tol biopolymer transport system component